MKESSWTNGDSRGNWLLCWLLFAATALSFLDRQVLSVLAPTLTAEFSLSNTAYSRVVFAFQLSYIVMSGVGGRVMDWLGTRVGMALSVAVWSIASAAHSLVTGPAGLGASRFFLGFGEGSCFPGATKGATEWFPVEKRVLAIGIANGGSAFGAMIAPPLTAQVAARFGWRGAFIATGALGVLWLVAWLAAFRFVSVDASVRQAQEPVSMRRLLANKEVRWVLLSRFLFDPVFYFYMFWIPQYLALERGFSLAQIGNYYWIPFLVLGLSNILGGHLSDSLVRKGWAPRKARRALLAIAALVTPVSALAAIAPNTEWAIGLMSCLMLAHGLWISNFLGLLNDVCPSTAIGTLTGLSGAVGGIGGILANLAIGPLVDRFSFAPAFVVSGLLYLAALLVLFAGGVLTDNRGAKVKA